ncbi:MAG: hypothetical protein IT326_01610 [Anaerolineae bacterium]|nr:hypothetical protein [Anaerolineae bacterium]
MSSPLRHAYYATALLLLSTLALTACGVSDRYAEGEAAALVDRGLLTNEPCAPPCWQGVEIGDSREDALATLYVNPVGGEVTEREERIEWIDTRTPNSGGGYVALRHDTVFTIYYGLHYRLETQELIATIGEPEAYEPQHDRGYCGVVLYWPERGVAVEVPGKCQNPPPSPQSWDYVRIEPESLVLTALYFRQSNDMNEANLHLRGSEASAGKWPPYYHWWGYPGHYRYE